MSAKSKKAKKCKKRKGQGDKKKPDLTSAWGTFAKENQKLWNDTMSTFESSPQTEVWKQFSDGCTTFWSNVFSPPDATQEAEKLWMDYLKAMTETLDHVMGTEAFGSNQNRMLKEGLVWHENLRQMMTPSMESNMELLNLPSRTQLDRLLGRLVGLEDRLDDIETDLQRVLRKRDLSSRAVDEGV